MSFKDFRNALDENRAEGKIVSIIFYSIISSFVAFVVLYLAFFKDVDNLFGRFGYALFFCILSYAVILPAVHQIKVYKKMTCMSGMMVGMTIGMISGFLIGFFVGAVSGMFYGGVFGMTIGICLGVNNGRCCGIMGMMEGMMAGFMGGLMGAMTAIMLITDHMFAAGIILFFIGATIMFGLNYMVYIEAKDYEFSLESLSSIIGLSLFCNVITFFFIIYGPKGGIFA